MERFRFLLVHLIQNGSMAKERFSARFCQRFIACLRWASRRSVCWAAPTLGSLGAWETQQGRGMHYTGEKKVGKSGKQWSNALNTNHVFVVDIWMIWFVGYIWWDLSCSAPLFDGFQCCCYRSFTAGSCRCVVSSLGLKGPPWSMRWSTARQPQTSQKMHWGVWRLMKPLWNIETWPTSDVDLRWCVWFFLNFRTIESWSIFPFMCTVSGFSFPWGSHGLSDIDWQQITWEFEKWQEVHH